MRRANCCYATVDEHNPPRQQTGCERAIVLPNVVPDIVGATGSASAGPGQRLTSDTPTVSLVARRDVVKNIPNQIIALSIANRARPLRCLQLEKAGLRRLMPSDDRTASAAQARAG